MTVVKPKSADSPQKNISHYINLNNQISMLGIGFVCAILAMSIANGLDMLRSFIAPTPYYLREVIGMRYVMIIVSTLGGFALGWFLSPKAKPFRTLLLGGIVGVIFFLIAVDYGVLGWGSAGIATWVAFFMGLGYWLRKNAKGFSDRFKNPPTTFGSSQWASFLEMVNFGLLKADGFRMGTMLDDKGDQQDIFYNGDRHMLTIAPNRSGKGTTGIIPNLLTYGGSVMVIDPKGENSMITASHREKEMGQDVLIVDPWHITGLNVACFNPMDWLVKGDVDIGENALLLADAIIVTMGENEQFWTEEAKALLLGVLLLVALDDSFAGRRNLGQVRDLLCLEGDELTKMFKMMLKCPNPIVRSTGARCLQKGETLLSNVLASVQAQTHFLDSQRIRKSMEHSDFSFEDLKSKPTSIYIVLPSDRLDTYGRWLRLLIQQALTINARNIEKKPEKPVLFILDELPALGKLSMVETAFGLMAGYGIQIWGICQDASQLKRIYGDGWETFISNAGMIQYFGSRDRMTTEYFSALCGVTSVWNFSTAVARAFGVTHGKDTSRSKTETTTDTANCTQRKLAFPDELTRMSKNKQLILVENMNPIIATKQPWFENPDLKDLGVNLHDQN